MSIGVQPRITVDGHDYMLVSEHYAAIADAVKPYREALEDARNMIDPCQWDTSRIEALLAQEGKP